MKHYLVVTEVETALYQSKNLEIPCWVNGNVTSLTFDADTSDMGIGENLVPL